MIYAGVLNSQTLTNTAGNPRPTMRRSTLRNPQFFLENVDHLDLVHI